jgi:hypothetical protein
VNFPDGRRYAGTFRNGQPNGRGVLTFPDGRRYDGEFRDGRYEGHGVFLGSDRQRYEGDFRDGRANGRGVLVDPDGSRYEGEFRDDKFHGRGIFTFSDGRRYEGDFRDGQASGRGVLVYADGGRYEGEFRDNKFNGPGVRTWPNGHRYEGQFQNGQAEQPDVLGEQALFTLMTRFAVGLSVMFYAALGVIFLSLLLKLAGLVSRRLRTPFDHLLNGVLLGSGCVFAALWLLSPLSLMHSVPFLAVAGFLAATMWLALRLIPLEAEPELDHRPQLHGTWAKIRERFIHFWSLEPPLRLLTVLAMAQLLASALLLIVYQAPTNRLPLDVQGHVYMERWIFDVSIAFFVVAWAVVLVGVSAGPMALVVVLGLLTITTLPWPLASRDTVMVWAVMVVAIWSWAVVTWRYRRRLREQHALTVPWSHTLTSVLFLVGVLGAAYGILGLRLSREGPGAFPAFVTEHLFRFSLCLVPILFLTGKECAEIAELVAHTVVRPIPRRRVRRVVSLLSVLVPGGILFWAMRTSRIDISFRDLVTYFAPTDVAPLGLVSLVSLVMLAGLAYTLRRSDRRPVRIVAGCLMILGGMMALVMCFVMIVVFSDYGVAVAVLAVGSVGALWNLLRRTGSWQWRSAHVPFAALLVVAVFLTGMHEIATLWQAAYSEPPMRGMDMRFSVTQCTDPWATTLGVNLPECSLAYPTTWQRAVVPKYRTLVLRDPGGGLGETDFRFPDFGSGASVPAFLVTELEVPPSDRATEEIDLLRAAEQAWPFLYRPGVGTSWQAAKGRRASAGQESIVYTDGKRQHVWIWVRRIDQHVWILGGYGPERYRGHYGHLYDEMVASWRPDRGAQVPPAVAYMDLKSTALRMASFGVLPAMLAPIGVGLLLLPWTARSTTGWSSGVRRFFADGDPTAARSFGGPRDVAGCFIVAVAVIAFVFFPHGALTELFGQAESPASLGDPGGKAHVSEGRWEPSGQGIKTLQIFVAAATLLLALVLTLRRRMMANARLLIELLQLNIAVALLGILYWFFSALAWASEISVWAQAGLLIVLKSWDFWTSGKDVTNRTGRFFLRRDLVLMYLGYLMLVSTAILYVSAQRLTESGRPIERFFDAESLLSQGIIWLGAPLLLFGFLFRIRGWLLDLFPRALTHVPPSSGTEITPIGAPPGKPAEMSM